MPNIGDIRKGCELGYSGRGKRFWAACTKCGKERWVPLVAGLPENKLCISCTRKLQFRVISNHPSWRGGRSSTIDGYVQLWIARDDFFFPMARVMTGHSGRVLEHRLVMAKHLNRCLLPWEIVHHKNGIRDDNRIENLQMLPSQTHHVSDSILKNRVKKLETLVEKQAKEIKLLQWHINELNKINKEVR